MTMPQALQKDRTQQNLNKTTMCNVNEHYSIVRPSILVVINAYKCASARKTIATSAKSN